jgi:hypothetical protein
VDVKEICRNGPPVGDGFGLQRHRFAFGQKETDIDRSAFEEITVDVDKPEREAVRANNEFRGGKEAAVALHGSGQRCELCRGHRRASRAAPH